MTKLKDLPQELIRGRELIEGNVIGSLWKNPLIYYDSWNLTVNDFLTEDGKIYFELGKNLYTAGFKIFDFIAVTTYLEKNEALNSWFNGKGGYKAIEDIINSIDEENADAYYDTLIKYNILINLHNNGFDVLPHLSKFEKMPSEMVYQFYDFKLNNVFIQKQVATEIRDLIIDDKFLLQCDSGMEMGISYGKHCPLLSYTTCGIHTKNLMLIAGFSGTGKTSFVVANMVLPLLEQGEKVAIISNEQNINEYKRTLLASAISNELGDFSVTRKHLQIGSWTDEQKESIKAGQEYINQFEGSLKFAQCYDYDISTVKKIIRTLSKQGFKYFIYDTFKAADLSVTNSWGHMVEDSKELFQIANKEDVAIIATMQLAISLMNTRYLTAECLSTAKGVKEVCSDIILMRPLWEDEYTGSTKDVKGYYYPKLPDGKYSKEKQEIYTMPDNKYMAVFIDKTRSGESGQQLLYKVNLAFNNWKELGFCKVREI